MIPCIEDKCLKYPVCKRLKCIRCDELLHYFINSLDTGLTPEKAFKKLRKDNILSIQSITTEYRQSNEPYIRGII